MKYIEELNNGDCFRWNEKLFLLCSDFKKSGDRLVISMDNGFPLWLSNDAIVEVVTLYTLDSDNNVISIKASNIPQVSSLAYQSRTAKE